MALCPKPDVCGSCGWSHIPYDKQLQQKLSDINGSFKLKNLDVIVDEIFASPKTEHYRNRMDFVISFRGEVGLREKGKWWRVIDDHTCFLADERIDALFPHIREWAQTCGLACWDRKTYAGTLRYAVVRATSTGETMITVVTSAPREGKSTGVQKVNSDDTATITAALNEVAKPTTLVWAINHTVSDVSFGDEHHVISGAGAIEEAIDGVRYRISPNAFFQTNSYAAPMLLATVREFAGDLTGKTLLDLYCGTGFFAVAMAGQAARTMGIEMVADAVNDARMNAELDNLASPPPRGGAGGGVEFHDAKTEAFDWASIGADVVILDPPRSGMHDKAFQDVMAAKPKRIVYVSCNYKNFARELVILREHYDVDAMRAIDMFPHTPHVELVTSLVLR